VSVLDKDSSVKLRAVLEIPGGSAKIYWAASIMGSWVPVYGAEVQLKPGERAVATRLSKRQRAKVCDELAISVKRFDNAVSDWVKGRLAHRCKGAVTLFTTPLRGDLAICPSCREFLDASRTAGRQSPVPREKASRSTGDTADRITASTSENERDPLKVIQQGEGEGSEAPPAARTALQEVLEEEQEALARFRAAFPESKEAAS
jgi:hypothetical protein